MSQKKIPAAPCEDCRDGKRMPKLHRMRLEPSRRGNKVAVYCKGCGRCLQA